MTGARARRFLREDMEKRYYRLGQFLGCCLHEDWPAMYGTPEAAVDAAIREYPLELRQQTRKELASLLAEFGNDRALALALNYGLGVCVWFKEAARARAFAEQVENKLMLSIREDFEERRS